VGGIEPPGVRLVGVKLATTSAAGGGAGAAGEQEAGVVVDQVEDLDGRAASESPVG
jgi:hypothetical protein